VRVLYIDLDSLRPDHLGCYGYGRRTSPNIDRIAAEGIRFSSCYASDVPCMPSRTSLFSGRLGIHHGCVSHTGTRAEAFTEGPSRPFRTDWGRTAWMRQLRNAGVRTVTFSGFAERHAAWHWYAGFQEIHDTGAFGRETADQVAPAAIAWLRESGRGDDWFLHVNLWDIHVPYRTPEAVGNRFANEPVPDSWLTEELLEMHRRQPGIRSARDALFLAHAEQRPDLNPPSLETLADVKRMVDGYDTAISHADDHVGRILSVLDDLGILRETAVIIGADHGECLGELNAYGGHCFADACTTRVPLIVRWPGVTDAAAGQCDEELHYHIDLAPTVNKLLAADIPDTWDAQGMAPAVAGVSGSGRDHLVLSQLAQTCQRAVVFRSDGEDYLYLRTLRSGYYAIARELLFNLTHDPHETRDLADERADLAANASQLLENWRAAMLADRRHGDPLDTVLKEPPEQSLERYAERLRSTGREDWIERVVQRADEERHANG
jgi:arylsulfatase A-like enzyme